jgi:hypothetical protein
VAGHIPGPENKTVAKQLAQTGLSRFNNPAPMSQRADRGAALAVSNGLSIIAFSDCRTQSIAALLFWIRRLSYVPDLVVYAGDDYRRFRPNEGVNYFERLAKLARYGLVAVAGNDDDPALSRSLIQGENVYEVHSDPAPIGPIWSDDAHWT